MVNSPGIRGVSPEEEKEGYGGKDLQKKKFIPETRGSILEETICYS